MESTHIIPDLREYLTNNDIHGLREVCSASHPGVIADALAGMPVQEIWQILSHVEPMTRAEVFSCLDEDIQTETAEMLSRRELASLVSDMRPDDRVDLLKRIPEEQRELLLPALAHAEREDIRKLSSYEEGTAGSIMTSEYVSLPADITAGEAIARLRREAPNKETIYYAYVVDNGRRLLGFLSLKDLILSRPHTLIKDIMHEEVISANVRDDQEKVARTIQKYDLIALPVTNGNDALVGIITHDDAIDIITQEHTEDMEKLMAISGSHEAGVYLRTSSWTHFKNRAGWVVGLAALGLISGMIIQSFEATLTQMIILAMYMPMLADTGGNTGSQSATVVVRALALNEITPHDVFLVLFKELKISLLLAAVLGLLSFAKVMFISQAAVIPQGFSLSGIGMVIGLALSIQVITATIVGALLPLIAARLKLDPAVVASPALTTVVDITGLIIYFATARLILGV